MGTFDSSVFREREARPEDGKHDYLFNGPGDGGRHGHVVEGLDSTPDQTTYDYVRDVEGVEYKVRPDTPYGSQPHGTGNYS